MLSWNSNQFGFRLPANVSVQEIINSIKNKVSNLKTEARAKWFIDYRETDYTFAFFVTAIENRKAKEAGKAIVG